MKVCLIIIAILIVVILLLILILRNNSRKLSNQKNQITSLTNQNKDKETQISKLMEEIEIEKRHKKELAKKLADISCMSIDDVLGKLQNNNG